MCNIAFDLIKPFMFKCEPSTQRVLFFYNTKLGLGPWIYIKLCLLKWMLHMLLFSAQGYILYTIYSLRYMCNDMYLGKTRSQFKDRSDFSPLVFV